MKRYIYSLFTAIVAMFTLSGCLSHGLDELDTYDGADITGLQGIYYRYIDESSTNPGSGEHKVCQVTLARAISIDKENCLVELLFQEPSNFPADQLPYLSASNLVVVLNISTAATIEPIDGAPRLGVPGDWSKANQYKVTAANGDSKIWTVTMEYVPRN